MKILFLSDCFPPQNCGSAGVIAFNLACALKKEGHEVFAITTVRTREEEGLKNIGGIEIHNIFTNYHERWQAYLSLYNPQTVKKVEKIIKRINPEIVHAHNIHYYLSYHCLKLAKITDAKVFLTAHDVMLFNYGKLRYFIDSSGLFSGKTPSYKVNPWRQMKDFKRRYNPFRNIIIRHYLKYVHKIFAVSEALKKALNDNDISNVEVIHNGINTDEWKIESQQIAEFKNRYDLFDKKIILFGGRLSSAKGGEKIILAMKEIVRKEPTAILLVVGGAERDNYARLMLKIAGRLGVKENIVFTGWLSGNALKTGFSASDLVVIPSICFDSFPTVALEAMACEKPVIGSYFGGIQEIIDDDITGYIVNPFNIKSLSEKILYLLENPQRARELGANGYKRVRERFSFDDQVRRTVFWYRALHDSIKTD